MEKQLKNISKFMSLVLRHRPEQIGLQLNEQGWADTRELIDKLNQHGAGITPEILNIVVDSNEKKRFAFNEDKSMIRANQGHSLEVDLNLVPVIPPEFLYHGTAVQFVAQILREGLQKQQRHHVHMSTAKNTALDVGGRRGKPVILKIAAARMHAAGYTFYISENEVWLTDTVPADFLETEQ
jgi:putative RNA 2'-phosphotransferase